MLPRCCPAARFGCLDPRGNFPVSKSKTRFSLAPSTSSRLIGGVARTMFSLVGDADVADVWLRSTAKRFMLDLKGKPFNATLGESSSDRVSDSLGR